MEDDAVFEERQKFCDLLIGRYFRLLIELRLERVLAAEAALDWLLGSEHETVRKFVDESLMALAHMEWVASISERGFVFWGQRLNRCGVAEGREGDD